MRPTDMSIHESIKFATERRLGPQVLATLQQAAAKYDKRKTNRTRPNLGDLSNEEIARIQEVADAFQIDIVVVGSALYGKRIGVGSSMRIGHGSDAKSDIDYIIPNKSVQWMFQVGPFDNPEDKPQAMLPDFDKFQGVNFTTPHNYLHRLWFKPKAKPRLLKPGMPNLGLAPPPVAQ